MPIDGPGRYFIALTIHVVNYRPHEETLRRLSHRETELADHRYSAISLAKYFIQAATVR
jgi:hypothetical protein